MLKCKEIVEKSSDFVDGQLTLKGKIDFYWHIFMCVHCRRFLRQLRLMLSSMPYLDEKELTDNEVELIMQRVKENKPE